MDRKKKSAPQGNTIPFIDFSHAQQRPFHIRHLTYSTQPDALKEAPHRHNFQELIWIEEGEGKHVVDNVVLTIKPRMLYLIAQGQVHYFLKGIGLKGCVICFTDEFFSYENKYLGWDFHATLFNLFTINRSLEVSILDTPEIKEIIGIMFHEYTAQKPGLIQILSHLLSILLIKVDRIEPTHVQDGSQISFQRQKYQAFIDQLELDYKKHHDVGYYAYTLKVTARHLSDIVRIFSGKTAKRIIIERHCLEAKRYLHHTNMPIKEMAYLLGFQDPSYFTKIFKHITGQSPNSYREFI